MLQLSSAQRRELRARAHNLNPVVSIAENGLTDAVLKEIDNCLKAHELIKIRVYGDSREDRIAAVIAERAAISAGMLSPQTLREIAERQVAHDEKLEAAEAKESAKAAEPEESAKSTKPGATK